MNDWLIELSDNNLASELVKNRSFFYLVTIKEIVIFMINNNEHLNSLNIHSLPSAWLFRRCLTSPIDIQMGSILQTHNRVYSAGIWSSETELSACPREHQVVVLHAISPISMKLCQFKGSTPNSKWQSRFCFRYFRGEIDPPPFSWVFTKKSLQNR